MSNDWFVIREYGTGNKHVRYHVPGRSWGCYMGEYSADATRGWSARRDAEDAAHNLDGRVVHRDELAALYDMWKAKMAVEVPNLSKYAIQVTIDTAGWFDGDDVTIPTEIIRQGGGT